MMLLHADENIPVELIRVLQGLEYDITTAEHAGIGISDAAVLAYATSKRRVVITFNRRDFIRLHEKSPEHAGIVVCTLDADLQALALRIHHALGAEIDCSGKLIRVTRPAT